jgi:hypothetical protein
MMTVATIYTSNDGIDLAWDFQDQLRDKANLEVRIVRVEKNPDSWCFLANRDIGPDQLPVVFLGKHQTSVKELLNSKFTTDEPEAEL